MKPKKILYCVIALITMIPGLVWLQQTGDLSVYFDGTAPDGQLAYVLSKLFGMFALAFIGTQVILSLCHALRLLDIRWLGQWHRWFGATIVLFSFVHLMLFFSAVTLRQDAMAFSLFFPDFSDYYHTHLSIGLLGFWILITASIFGWLRRKRRSPSIKRLHRLYWVAIVAVYFHALAVGSEAQSPAAFSLYAFLGVMMLALGLSLFVRWARSMNFIFSSEKTLLAIGFMLFMSSIDAIANKDSAYALMIIGYDGEAWYPYIATLEGDRENIDWKKVQAIENPVLVTRQPNSSALHVKKNNGAVVLYEQEASGDLKEIAYPSADSGAKNYTHLRAHVDGLLAINLVGGKSRDTHIVDFRSETDIPESILNQASAQFHPLMTRRNLYYGHVSCRLACKPVIQEVWRRDLVSRKTRQLTLLNATSYLHSVDADERYGYISSNQSGYYHLGRLDLSTYELIWMTQGQVTDTYPSITKNDDLYFIRRDQQGTRLMHLAQAMSRDSFELNAISLPPSVEKIRYLEATEL